MKKHTVKIFLSVFAPILAVSCILPIMSAQSFDGEAATFSVTGIGMVSIEPFSVIPLIFPIVFSLIILSEIDKRHKEMLMILLLIVDVIGMVGGFNASHEWLTRMTDTVINYHLCGVVYPISTPMLIVAYFVTKNIKEEEIIC